MMKTKTKNWTPKFIALAVGCLLIGVGIGLLGYHYFLKPVTPSDWQSTKIEPTKGVPTMMGIPHLTPQPGEYFTYRGTNPKYF